MSYDYNALVPEQKFFDKGEANYEVRNDGIIHIIFHPLRGADYNQRVGRKSVLRSIFIRGRLHIYQATLLPPSAYYEYVKASLNRLILFIDWQPNGATPAITDVLVSANPVAQLNPNNRKRFTIIKDKQWCFDNYMQDVGASVLNHNTTMYPIKIYERVCVEQTYNSNNFGDIRDIATGAVYMLLIGSNPPHVPNYVQFNVSIRCRFDDY